MRFIPRHAAAPSAPPTRPLHAVSTRTISSRCFLAYSSATLLLSLRKFALSAPTCWMSCRDPSVLVFWSSASGASSDLPLVRSTARSMKFSSSRILPGQSQVLSPFITAVGIASIGFCISLANFWTKWLTRRNVFFAVSQRRNTDRKNIQPIIQITAKFPVRNHRRRRSSSSLIDVNIVRDQSLKDTPKIAQVAAEVEGFK